MKISIHKRIGLCLRAFCLCMHLVPHGERFLYWLPFLKEADHAGRKRGKEGRGNPGEKTDKRELDKIREVHGKNDFRQEVRHRSDDTLCGTGCFTEILKENLMKQRKEIYRTAMYLRLSKGDLDVDCFL